MVHKTIAYASNGIDGRCYKFRIEEIKVIPSIVVHGILNIIDKRLSERVPFRLFSV